VISQGATDLLRSLPDQVANAGREVGPDDWTEFVEWVRAELQPLSGLDSAHLVAMIASAMCARDADESVHDLARRYRHEADSPRHRTAVAKRITRRMSAAIPSNDRALLTVEKLHRLAR